MTIKENKKYTLADGIRDACERAKRINERISVWSDGENVWVRTSNSCAPALPIEVRWIGEAMPSGEFIQRVKS